MPSSNIKVRPSPTDSRVVFSTEWFDIAEEKFAPSRGREEKPHYTMRRQDGVIVLALTPDDEIILVRQFRPSVESFTLELPCGGVESHQTPQEAAPATELYEETGFVCSTLNPLGVGRLMMNRVRAREHLFFGVGARRSPSFVPTEDIEVLCVPSRDFKQLVLSGEFEHLATLGTLLMAIWSGACKPEAFL